MRQISHFTCLSIFLSAAVFADESQIVTSLDRVTIYATRSPQLIFDLPASVSKLDTDTPGNALSSDVADLLEFTPGVEIEGGPRHNGQTISIRGFDAESIITLIDSRRQNFESAHDGRFFIDPFLLKSVDIVKGASSAIYGGGGIGGVAVFETKDAADLLSPEDHAGVQVSLGLRSANDEHSSAVTGFARTTNWDVVGSISYRDSGDIETGDGGHELDAEDQIFSGLFKAGYTFSNFHTLKFLAQLLNNDGQEPNNGAGTISFSNPIVDKEVKDHQFGLKYVFEHPGNQWLNPKLHMYFNNTEVEETDITGHNAGRTQSREMDTLGFTIDNQTRVSNSRSHSHILSYGFEIYNDEQTGKTKIHSTSGMRGGVPDADATSWGIYLQDEIAIRTSAGNFLIIPAVRFDDYESDDEEGHSQDENEFSPKLSISYKPTDKVMLYGSWADAFRAPNLTELYASGRHFPAVPPVPCPPHLRNTPACPPSGNFFDGFPENRFTPNPGLKPETVTTVELGIGFDLSGVFASKDRLQVKGSWFTSDGSDFIAQEINVFRGYTKTVNIRNAELRGWEAESQYQLLPFNAKLGLSYVKAENDDTGEYLSNNVPLTLVTDISFHTNAGSVVGWRSRFTDKNDNVGEDDVPTSGYGVHDLYYRWTSNTKGSGSITVDLGVENLFDKDYTKRFASLQEEGRSIAARLSYEW